MKNAKAYIIISPEYNYNVTPVLSNFLAWVSTIGDDFRLLFTNKVVLLATASGGDGKSVLTIMRSVFTSLGAIVIPRDICVTYSNPIKPESVKKILTQFISIEEKINK